jgi:hypothetical protein
LRKNYSIRKSLIIRIFLILFLSGALWGNYYGSIAGNPETPLGRKAGGAGAGGENFTIWFPIIAKNMDVPVISCFERAGPVITISGEQSEQIHTGGDPLAKNAIVDARTARWMHVDDYPLVLEGGPGVCFSGATVWGVYPYSTEWESMHDTTGLTIRTTGNTTVENFRVHNYGDGVSFSRGTPRYSFQVVGAHMTHIRDDCVQNDYMYSGLIEDSFFDGCYTAFSAQASGSSGENDGSHNVWTIRNSLIRLKPMEKVYEDRGLIPGHGAFFKWNKDNDHSPRLSLHNNIFRADQPSNSSSGLGVPQGKQELCSKNIVVWLGDGPYPDPLPTTFNGEPCFTITTDQTVWDNAVKDWMNRHELMQ